MVMRLPVSPNLSMRSTRIPAACQADPDPGALDGIGDDGHHPLITEGSR